MTSLFIDDRYRGAHGIGRYAAEIVPRLRPARRSLNLSGHPHSPLDAFRPLPEGARDSLVYSPGYGALVRAQRQILTIHDLIHLRTPWPQRAKYAAYYAGPVRRVVREAGIVLTVSKTSADDIREWLRDDDVRVVVTGIGYSSVFRPDGGTCASEDPYVLFVGNIRRHKNLDLVLRALALAPGVRLRAVVPAREIDVASARAVKHRVADRVEWFSDIGDDVLAMLYRGAGATVVPSTLEGFGLPALESIACGVPVLYWRGCEAVAEVVRERGTALDSAQDVDEWAAALTASTDAALRVAPPSGSFDWNRAARIVSDVLETALSETISGR